MTTPETLNYIASCIIIGTFLGFMVIAVIRIVFDVVERRKR